MTVLQRAGVALAAPAFCAKSAEAAVTDRKAAKILHVSGDYPDAFDTFKTPVIRSLVELTRDKFDHEVISVNRRSPGIKAMLLSILRGHGKPKVAFETQSFSDGTSLRYYAPGRGVFHATMLHELGNSLVEYYPKSKGGTADVDLIIGHKLSIEGLAVRRMAKSFGVPYAISIQGDTDTKILRMRPDLAPEFRKVLHEAAVVFPFSPWAMTQIEKRLGKRSGLTITLPCPTDLDSPLTPTNVDNRELLTVFHLKNRKRKNLAGLVAAMRIVERKDPSIHLSVIGGGSESDVKGSQAIIGNQRNVQLVGPLDHAQLRNRFNASVGFVMPSLRESFGLVFVEALFSGSPIIYPKGTSVDGFFDNSDFAFPVSASSPEEIAAAILQLVNEQRPIKASLAAWQVSDASARFTRPNIAQSFATALQLAIVNASLGK